MVVAEALVPKKQVRRDYGILWDHIGPRDIHNGSKPVPLQRSMLPERRVMIVCICNHVTGCPLCRGQIGSRLNTYLKEVKELA